MKVALFVCSCILIISLMIACIITFSTNKYILPRSTAKELIIIPHKDLFSYNEQNIKTSRIHCISEPLYSVFPEPKIESLLHVPWTISQQQASLNLSDSGLIEYSVNNIPVWNSSQPRKYMSSTYTNAMEKLGFEHWKGIDKVQQYSLSLYPFAIFSDQKVHWTYASGYEPFCTTLPDCPVAIPSKQEVKGKVILFSKNRRYRLALLNNGDLVVLNIQSDKPGSHILKKTVTYSLIESCCK